jgi:hypothetical protein
MLNMPRTNDYGGLASNNSTLNKTFKPAYEETKLVEWQTNKKLNRELFDGLFHGLARNLSKPQKDYVEDKLSIGLSIDEIILNRGTKDEYRFISRRCLVPFFDKNNLVWNYCAYDRNSKLKGAKRKGGKPALAGENFIKSYGKNILWVEGDSDYIHAQGFGLDSVTAGSASMRITQFLPNLRGKSIYFLVDNDKAGADAIARWHTEILEYNETVSPEEAVSPVFLWWSDRSYRKARQSINSWIESYYEKKLLPNFKQLAKNSQKNLLISVMLNDGLIRKKGYDLVDYIGEFGPNSLGWFEQMFRS